MDMKKMLFPGVFHVHGQVTAQRSTATEAAAKGFDMDLTHYAGGSDHSVRLRFNIPDHPRFANVSVPTIQSYVTVVATGDDIAHNRYHLTVIELVKGP